MHQIEDGIYYEDAYSGVTLGAIILSHGTILIDSPLRGEDARSWRATLVNMGGSTNRVLVNLDAHPDRTLGTRAMDTTIVTHHKTALTFRNRPTIFKGQNQDSGADWEMNDEVIGTRWSTPDITFTQQLVFHWGEPEVILEHHPGPALGSIWTIVPAAKVIFVGDAIIPEQPPFLAHADLPAWIESLDVLLATYRDYTIICGRGGPVGAEAVRAQKSYLKKILKGLERVAKRSAGPEMTEGLIAGLIKDLSIPSKLQEHYVQRLRNGLYQYYSRHYRPVEAPEED
ncbi:MAG TPA: MBL fold metallo-hydrolase [Anaerolineales bacterium]|nr:MBL fold metallo-hydrolase [Anaerolineales bacterium]